MSPLRSNVRQRFQQRMPPFPLPWRGNEKLLRCFASACRGVGRIRPIAANVSAGTIQTLSAFAAAPEPSSPVVLSLLEEGVQHVPTF